MKTARYRSYMFYRKVLAMIIWLAYANNIIAQESSTTYNFLRLPVSAHAAALGGAGITVIDDDASLTFSNPALLTSVSDKTIDLNYMNYMSGTNNLSAIFTRTVGDKASWGVSGQYVDYGTMRQTDVNGNDMGDFSARDIALSGHFAYILSDKISGGVSARIVTSYIGDYNSMAVGFDLGLNYYNPTIELSVSIVAKNLGGQLDSYDEDYEKMPIDLQLGASKRLGRSPLTLYAMLENLNSWDEPIGRHVALGVQADLSDNIWIGGGYNFRRAKEMNISSNDDTSSSHGAGLSLGGGLSLERFKLHIAYGKYHVSSHSLLINVAYSL